ncbi:hypothetical protein [Cryobacterium sp. MLB-32]|nr:hypothetical protein [Cryobacterium sp. MLB-32]
MDEVSVVVSTHIEKRPGRNDDISTLQLNPAHESFNWNAAVKVLA